MAACAGLAHGLLFAWSGWRATGVEEGIPLALAMQGFILALVLPVVLMSTQRWLGQTALQGLATAGNVARWHRIEAVVFAIFALSGALGTPVVARSLAIAVVFGLVQAVVIALLLKRTGRDSVAASPGWIPALFLISGFAALIYQVVWQRVLFTTFGVNSESVTVIVSVFMFGLGVGALAGGWLQQRFPLRRLRLFLVLEVLIGVFGLFSLELIGLAGASSRELSLAALVIRVYAVLAIPTLLMGATLPILVAFLQDYYRHMGKTVSQLYALNTFGSAVAAFATVSIIFVLAGLKAAIVVAAACNLGTALLIADASRRRAALPLPAAHTPSEPISEAPITADPIALPIALVLLALLGFVSLGQEILWFRLIGFMSGSKPEVFGFMLTAFLVGIAAGSSRATSATAHGKSPAAALARWILASTAIFFFSVPLVAHLPGLIGTPAAVGAAYLAVAAVAYYSGGALPVLVQMATQRREGDAARVMSLLYFANIIGATAGPLVVGFVLLDHVSLQASIAWISGLGLIVAAMLAALVRPMRLRSGLLASCAAAMAGGFALYGAAFAGYLEGGQFIQVADRFKTVVENRAGIITVSASAAGDMMFGGGAYDGRFNTSPLVNTNGIDRAYMVAALHRKPDEVLEIGLSTGSWTWVLSRSDSIANLTVVEINKAYPEVASRYQPIAGILSDPKVNIQIDDARRWLRNHPERKFDLIVMNTTYHWRSNSTNLLSREFLELCREHLNPGGVMYYNTTGSDDVVHTAAHVFKHVVMVAAFVAASDVPFDMSPEERRANLLRFKDANGSPIFTQDEAHRRTLDRFVDWKLPDVRDRMLTAPGLRVVTDDNMAVEFKQR